MIRQQKEAWKYEQKYELETQRREVGHLVSREERAARIDLWIVETLDY
jgi:hypothetical protein